jgi:hypothetical protein
VIDVEFDKEDYGLIPATAFWRGLNHLISEITLKSDSTGNKSKKKIFFSGN